MAGLERGRGGKGRSGRGECAGVRGEHRKFFIFLRPFRAFPSRLPRPWGCGGEKPSGPANSVRQASSWGSGGFPGPGGGHAFRDEPPVGRGIFLAGAVRSFTAISTPAVRCAPRSAGMRGCPAAPGIPPWRPGWVLGVAKGSASPRCETRGGWCLRQGPSIPCGSPADGAVSFSTLPARSWSRAVPPALRRWRPARCPAPPTSCCPPRPARTRRTP